MGRCRRCGKLKGLHVYPWPYQDIMQASTVPAYCQNCVLTDLRTWDKAKNANN